MMMEMPISSGSRNRQADSGPVDWRQLAQWLLDDQVISVQEHQRIVARCSSVKSSQHPLLRLAQVDVTRTGDCR